MYVNQYMYIFIYTAHLYITSIYVYICINNPVLNIYIYLANIYMVDIYIYIHVNRFAVHTYGTTYLPTVRYCVYEEGSSIQGIAIWLLCVACHRSFLL